MKKLLATLLASALLLSFAACGGNTSSTKEEPAGNETNQSEPAAEGGDEGGSEAPSGEIQYSQGADDSKIVIANSAATSGAYAPIGVPFLAGIEAYLEMVNAGGGIDGREIVFNHYTDDEFDPAKGKAALAGMVEDEKVFSIVGHFGTPVVAATVDDLKDYGIPAVYFATGIGQLYAEGAKTNDDGYNIFPVQPIYYTEARIMVAYAVGSFDAQKIGIIYTNDDAGMDFYAGAQEQVALLDGVELVAEQVTAGTADVSAAVTSIKNADVDFIILGSIQGTLPTIVKELAAQSVNVDGITTYVNVSDSMSDSIAADIAGKFDVYGLGWVAYDDLDALALYQEYAPDEYAMNPYAQTGWIAAHFFCEGLRRIEGQDITWENYMSALEDGPIQNPFGGKLDYSNGNRMGTQEMNLSRVVGVSEEYPIGWEVIEPLQSIDDLLAK